VIVLDTNVISELMRAEPHPTVVGWVARQPRAVLYTTYINQAEILYGIGALPEGRRRTALAAAAEAVFAEGFCRPYLTVRSYSSLALCRHRRGAAPGRQSDRGIRRFDRGDCIGRRRQRRHARHCRLLRLRALAHRSMDGDVR